MRNIIQSITRYTVAICITLLCILTMQIAAQGYQYTRTGLFDVHSHATYVATPSALTQIHSTSEQKEIGTKTVTKKNILVTLLTDTYTRPHSFTTDALDQKHNNHFVRLLQERLHPKLFA